MKGYINRDEAIELIRKDNPGCVFYNRSDAIDLLNCMPTVDVMPVHRCKDCEFWEIAKYEEGTKDVCRLLKHQMHADDFCSYYLSREDASIGFLPFE